VEKGPVKYSVNVVFGGHKARPFKRVLALRLKETSEELSQLKKNPKSDQKKIKLLDKKIKVYNAKLKFMDGEETLLAKAFTICWAKQNPNGKWEEQKPPLPISLPGQGPNDDFDIKNNLAYWLEA
jgi:hypothetical protein